MRRIFRWAFRLLVLLLVLAVAAVLLLDTIVREVTEYRIRRETGLDVRISRMRVGILNPWVTIEKLMIYNSAEFGGTPLVDMPEVHLEYDRSALWSRKLRFKLVRLNLAQVNVVEDRRGRLNLEELQKRLNKSIAPQASSGRSAAHYAVAGIGTLNLTLGHANFTSLKEPGHNQVLKMDMRNQVLLNVKSWNDLGPVFTTVMLWNNVNLMGKHGRRPDDPWLYWTDRLGMEQK